MTETRGPCGHGPPAFPGTFVVPLPSSQGHPGAVVWQLPLPNLGRCPCTERKASWQSASQGTLPRLLHLSVLAHPTGLVALRLAQLLRALIKFLLCIWDTTPCPDLLPPDTVSPSGASSAVWMEKLRYRAC